MDSEQTGNCSVHKSALGEVSPDWCWETRKPEVIPANPIRIITIVIRQLGLKSASMMFACSLYRRFASFVVQWERESRLAQ